MADNVELGLAFLEAHPAEAARVLESLPTHEACALFTAIEPKRGAKAWAAMLPTAAARILSSLPEADAVALAAASSTYNTVAVLRHVAPDLRGRILARLPTAQAVAAQMLLGFPDDTVGAWTDTGIVVIPSACSVADALLQLRVAPEGDLDQVFIVDADHHPQGCVGLHALLKADPRTLAGSLAKPIAATLSAMMPMSSVRASNLWERSQVLPVLDRDQRLIGVLRRSSLVRAMRSRPGTAGPSQRPESVTGTLASSYWGIVSSLSSSTLSLLPTVKRVGPDDA